MINVPKVMPPTCRLHLVKKSSSALCQLLAAEPAWKLSLITTGREEPQPPPASSSLPAEHSSLQPGPSRLI